MLSGNSVLAERSWSIINLIINKTRNSLKLVNVDKLTFIYLNNWTLNRPQDTKEKLKFAGIDIDEEYLCEMENSLLQKETVIFSNGPEASKRPASQQITGDAIRLREEV